MSTQRTPDDDWQNLLPERGPKGHVPDRSRSVLRRWPAWMAVVLLGLFWLLSALNSRLFTLELSPDGRSLLIRQGAFFPRGRRQGAEPVRISRDDSWLQALSRSEQEGLARGLRVRSRPRVEERIRALLISVALRRMDGGTVQERQEAIQLLRRAAQGEWDQEVRELLAQACLALSDLHRSAGSYEEAIRALNTGRAFGLTEVDRRIAELEKRDSEP